MKKLLPVLLILLSSCTATGTVTTASSPSPNNSVSGNPDSIDQPALNIYNGVALPPGVDGSKLGIDENGRGKVKNIEFMLSDVNASVGNEIILGGVVVNYEIGKPDTYVTYSSSDESMLQLLDPLSGAFKPLKAGTAQVIATSRKDPGVKAFLTVTISN